MIIAFINLILFTVAVLWLVNTIRLMIKGDVDKLYGDGKKKGRLSMFEAAIGRFKFRNQYKNEQIIKK